MEARLDDTELNLLKNILSLIVVKQRTGEVGILHGLNRFVSANYCLKKKDINTLKQIIDKLGNKEIKMI